MVGSRTPTLTRLENDDIDPEQIDSFVELTTPETPHEIGTKPHRINRLTSGS